MTIQQLIEKETGALEKAGGTRLGFFIQAKIEAIKGIIIERNYWKKRALEAEQRAMLLNQMYLSASDRETTYLEILIKSAQKNGERN
jgi:hypothetical protein